MSCLYQNNVVECFAMWAIEDNLCCKNNLCHQDDIKVCKLCIVARQQLYWYLPVNSEIEVISTLFYKITEFLW